MGIQSFKKINSLTIDSCTKIKDQGITQVGTCIAQHFKKLTFLELDFGRCIFASDQAFKQLTSSIGQNLKKLQYLSLNFNGYHLLFINTDFFP